MKPKLLTFILFFCTLCTFAYRQVPLCSKCHKPKTACICKATPTPPQPAKCKQCGSTSCRTKDRHKVCPTCKKYDFQCKDNLNHPCSQCGRKDCKTKNNHKRCTDINCRKLIGVIENACPYAGSHPIENAETWYARGKKHYDKQEFEQAVIWFRKAAEEEHVNSLYYLGECYLNATGVSQSYDEAAKFYKNAANHGHARAQWNIARLYERGKGVPQDYVEASLWYRKAADQGDTGAQINPHCKGIIM